MIFRFHIIIAQIYSKLKMHKKYFILSYIMYIYYLLKGCVIMKILVDADACPVKNIIVEIAKKYSIKVIMIIDTSHILNDGYSEVITVEKGKDSVDIALINRLSKDDIVVSQDYGVAAMAISKHAYAINQNGLIYTNDNIDRLLFERFLFQKVRRSGGRTINPRKRASADDSRFEVSFMKLIEEVIKKN